MARDLSESTTTGMMQERTANIQVLAAIIEHPVSGTVFHIVHNTENIIHNWVTYTAVGFSFTPPEEAANGFSTAVLTVNNVERWLTPYIRGLKGEVLVTLLHLSATNLATTPPVFDIVDLTTPEMVIRTAGLDAVSVQCDLGFDGVTDQDCPCYVFGPSEFMGLFWGAAA